MEKIYVTHRYGTAGQGHREITGDRINWTFDADDQVDGSLLVSAQFKSGKVNQYWFREPLHFDYTNEATE